MGTEARSSLLLTAIAVSFAVTLVRNETQRHSTALKSAVQSPIDLLPLGGVDSAVPSFQLHPVFGGVSKRVSPDDTMSCFVSLGDKSWDNFKNYFQTQGFEFLFLSQRAWRMPPTNSIAPKTPVLKLKCLFACEPPATIGSESTQVARAPFAKPQVAGLRHRWAK